MSNDAASVFAVSRVRNLRSRIPGLRKSGRRRTTGAGGLEYVDASLPLAGKDGEQEGQPANAYESRGRAGHELTIHAMCASQESASADSWLASAKTLAV